MSLKKTNNICITTDKNQPDENHPDAFNRGQMQL